MKTDAAIQLANEYPGLIGLEYGRTGEPIFDAIERQAAIPAPGYLLVSEAELAAALAELRYSVRFEARRTGTQFTSDDIAHDLFAALSGAAQDKGETDEPNVCGVCAGEFPNTPDPRPCRAGYNHLTPESRAACGSCTPNPAPCHPSR